MNIRFLLLSILLLSMATLVMAQATDLFLSEYVEGSSNKKALEIFNGTGAAVDLSQYSIKKQTNGAGDFGTELVLSSILNNNDCYVICFSSTTGTTLEGQPYVDLATTSFVCAFNGNDCVALCKNGVLLDVIGIVNQVTPDWGKDVTFRRNATVSSPRAIWDPAEWASLPIDTFDNLGIHTFTPGTNPSITVLAPNGAEQWNVGSTYQILWSHANFQGPVKIELLDGTTPTTLNEAAENNGTWIWNIPTSLPLGSNYKIRISSPTGNPVPPPDTSDNPFSLIPAVPVIDVANLAALRGSNPDNTTIYRMTGEAWVTYFRSTRNQKYVQDATGGILIDDPSAIITSQYMRGDGMINLKGKLTTYHAQYEFVPVEDPGQPSSQNTIQPQEVSLTELTTNFNNYNQELIVVPSVTFLPDTTEGIFVTATSYNITDPTAGTMIFRTNFGEADYLGTNIPTVPKRIVAIAIPYDATLQITARDLADITPVANDDPIATTSSPVLFGNVPNPFVGSTSIRFDAKSNNPVTIEVYNIKGQKVASIVNHERSTGYQSVSWNGTDKNGDKLPSGVYLYKMQSGSFSSTKKMILMK
jgi:hypothetical protein